ATLEVCAALCGVENELNPPVFDGIDNVGAAFQHLVDLFGRNPVFAQETLGTRRGDDLEPQAGQQPHGIENARLVCVPHRYEHGAALGQARAAADLALGEGDFE